MPSSSDAALAEGKVLDLPEVNVLTITGFDFRFLTVPLMGLSEGVHHSKLSNRLLLRFPSL